MSTDERSVATPRPERVDAVLGIGHYARPAAARGADRLLSIGVYSRRSRLSLKALRLYERLGLLTPAEVDRSSGYRRYRESQLATARLVAMLRRLDVPLAQVAEIVSAEGARGAELLASYWKAAERRFASQRELAAHLQIRLLGDDRSFDMFEIKEREVPEQTVLTEQRHVHAADLPAWLGTAIGRLHRVAESHGGVVAPTFVVYHGEVNEDSDGPVEVCVPIGADQAASTDAPTRREAAHHEAYTRLRKAQVEYPQILSAFDAVGQWVSSHGLEVAASPREVYFTDFVGAAPSDEVCDVAFPIR